MTFKKKRRRRRGGKVSALVAQSTRPVINLASVRRGTAPWVWKGGGRKRVRRPKHFLRRRRRKRGRGDDWPDG